MASTLRFLALLLLFAAAGALRVDTLHRVLSGLRTKTAQSAQMRSAATLRAGNQTNNGTGPRNETLEERIQRLEHQLGNLKEGPAGATGATGPGIGLVVGGALVGTCLAENSSCSSSSSNSSSNSRSNSRSSSNL